MDTAPVKDESAPAAAPAPAATAEPNPAPVPAAPEKPVEEAREPEVSLTPVMLTALFISPWARNKFYFRGSSCLCFRFEGVTHKYVAGLGYSHDIEGRLSPTRELCEFIIWLTTVHF